MSCPKKNNGMYFDSTNNNIRNGGLCNCNSPEYDLTHQYFGSKIDVASKFTNTTNHNIGCPQYRNIGSPGFSNIGVL